MSFPSSLISASIGVFSAVFLLAACGDPTPPGDESLSSIVIALEPDKDPDAMLADQRALTDYLLQATDLPVEVIIPMSSAVIREGLRNGTIDVAYVSSTVGVGLADDAIAELLLATEINGRPHYESYWLGRADSRYESVEELAGQPIVFASRTSTSGYIIPVWDLHKQGLVTVEGGPEAFFGEGNVTYGVGYVSAVERVLQGSVEATAVSNYVFDEDKHLSAGQRSRLKIIDTQGPVPSHVIVARSALSAEAITGLRRVLHGMNDGATKLRDRIFGAPLIEVDQAEHYAVTREALDLIERINNP